MSEAAAGGRGVRARGARAPLAPSGQRGRGEVTTACYVYSKPVIKNVSARAVRRPVIIQLKVSSRYVVTTLTGNAIRGSARATGSSARPLTSPHNLRVY